MYEKLKDVKNGLLQVREESAAQQDWFFHRQIGTIIRTLESLAAYAKTWEATKKEEGK